MEETWKIIDGFEDYEVSSCGRVKTKERLLRYNHAVTGNEHFRKSTERELKIHLNDLTGYKFVQLYSNKKMFNLTIHRLVALAFNERSDETFDVVNHKDGNKHNNTVDNLEWGTNAYNHEHATITGLKAKGSKISSAKLNDATVHAIKWFLSKNFSHSELSKAFKISRPTISMIANGKIWKHVEFTGEELSVK
jgi:hypothetical protein